MTLGLIILSTVFLSGASNAQETNAEILEKIWSIGRNEACTESMRSQFTPARLSEMKSDLGHTNHRSALAQVLNPFLLSLGKSHTEFFPPESEHYKFFKAFWELQNPEAGTTLTLNPGVQLRETNAEYIVREALDGSEAKRVGLRKGDRILKVSGKSFNGHWGEDSGPASILVERNGKRLKLFANLMPTNWHEAFHRATVASQKTYRHAGQQIGYVRLWTGTHPDSAEALQHAIAQFNAQGVDGIILDLRGGYGGAWWDHLDPFFNDRFEFFSATIINKDETAETIVPEPKSNHEAYLGPMVVLVDESVRSGKKALAYQFKKLKRAILIGANTPGYFTLGKLFFVEDPVDYVFYLCVSQVLLDGQEIEGIGIAPDVEVPFNDLGPHGDSQLEEALSRLAEPDWADTTSPVQNQLPK